MAGRGEPARSRRVDRLRGTARTDRRRGSARPQPALSTGPPGGWSDREASRVERVTAAAGQGGATDRVEGARACHGTGDPRQLTSRGDRRRRGSWAARHELGVARRIGGSVVDVGIRPAGPLRRVDARSDTISPASGRHRRRDSRATRGRSQRPSGAASHVEGDRPRSQSQWTTAAANFGPSSGSVVATGRGGALGTEAPLVGAIRASASAIGSVTAAGKLASTAC